MEREMLVTFNITKEEKENINQLIQGLSEIRKDMIVTKCEKYNEKIKEVNELLVSIRDGKLIKIE